MTEPVQRTAKLYSGEATGLLLHFPGWTYPAVIDPLFGTIQFDHFEGRWRDPRQLDRFLQAYAVERSRLEARRKGMPVSEQTLDDGSIKLLSHEEG